MAPAADRSCAIQPKPAGRSARSQVKSRSNSSSPARSRARGSYRRAPGGTPASARFRSRRHESRGAAPPRKTARRDSRSGSRSRSRRERRWRARSSSAAWEMSGELPPCELSSTSLRTPARSRRRRFRSGRAAPSRARARACRENRDVRSKRRRSEPAGTAPSRSSGSRSTTRSIAPCMIIASTPKRQMRPMLLHRRDRQHGDRARHVAGAKIGRCEVDPIAGGEHDATVAPRYGDRQGAPERIPTRRRRGLPRMRPPNFALQISRPPNSSWRSGGKPL